MSENIKNPAGFSAIDSAMKHYAIGLDSTALQVARLQSGGAIAEALRQIDAVSSLGLNASVALASGMTVGDLSKHLHQTIGLSTRSALSGEIFISSRHLADLGLLPSEHYGKTLNQSVATLVADLGGLGGVGNHFRNRFGDLMELREIAGVGKGLLEAFEATSLNFKATQYEQLIGSLAFDRASLGLMRSTSTFVKDHSVFVNSESLVAVDEDLRSLPSTGLLAHSALLRDLSLVEVEAEEDGTGHDEFIAENLERLDPALCRNYRGLKQAAELRGADWWTQASSSGRKLVVGALDTIAPDHVVRPWAKANGYKLEPKRQVPRSIKIAWLCEHISNLEYRKVVRSQLEANLSIFRYLNESQHVHERPELVGSFDSVVGEIEEMLRHLLMIWVMRLG